MLTILLVVLFGTLAFGQSPDFNSVRYKQLNCGLNLIYLVDTNFSDIILGFYSYYPPIGRTSLMGADRVFAKLTGGKVVGNLYVRKLYLNSAALDSSLRFIKYKVFQEKFSPTATYKAIQQIRKAQEQEIFSKAAYILTLGRKHFPHVSESLNADSLEIFRKRIGLSNSTLVVYGNFNPDSLVELSDSIFRGLRLGKKYSVQQKPVNHGFSLNFVNVPTAFRAKIGFARGINYNLAHNFFTLNALKYYIKITLDSSYVGLNQAFEPTVLYAFSKTDSIPKDFSELYAILTGFNQRLKSAPWLRKQIADSLSLELREWLRNPAQIIDFLYQLRHFNLGKNYFALYQDSISRLRTGAGFMPDLSELLSKSVFIIVGSRPRYECQLLKLSEKYRINIEDQQIYKYDVIPQGLNAQMVIERYLNFVVPRQQPRNLSIKFEGFFFTDSTFFDVFGYIFRKRPNLYKFLLYVRIAKDTFLLYKTQYDGQQWYDSTMLSVLKPDTLLRLKQYLFVEKYYPRLGYKPELICRPGLMSQGIYIIKVSTPQGLYFYDYYDNNRRIKLYTQYFDSLGRWQKTVFYSDYERISLGKSDIKLPFLIKEQASSYTFELRLVRVSTRSIPNYIFSYRR